MEKLPIIKILEFLLFHIILPNLSLFSIVIIISTTVNSNSYIHEGKKFGNLKKSI